MVTFCPEHGLASTIQINAELGTDVIVDFTVRHFQSLEGDLLTRYVCVSVCGFVLAGIILFEKLWTSRGWEKDEAVANLPGLFVDILVQVVLPLIYFSFRLSQVLASEDSLSETIGTQGLAGRL